MPTQPLVVLATFKIKAGEEETFKQRLLELGVDACLANEPGCEILWAHQDGDDPTRFMLYEHWTDQAAFEASFDRPWRDLYSEETEHLWEEPRVTTVWTMAGVPRPAPPTRS